MLASAGIQALGGLFQGFAQGKVSEQQLEMARLQHGLSREQFEFMKQMALRQNAVGQANTDRVSPLMMQMLGRSQENMNLRPEPVRLQPPNINNRYQPGVGSVGNPAPPPTSAMPWLNNGPQAGAQPDLAEQVPVPGLHEREMAPPQVASVAGAGNPSTQDPRELMKRMDFMKRMMAQRGAA